MKRLIGILVLALAVFAGAQEQQTLNNDSILKMVQAGLGENLIVTAVQTQPGKYSLSPDELIKLKQAGVSEKILAAMLKASGASASGLLPVAPVKIGPDTPIRLTVDDAVSSATAKPGDTFKLSAAEDLVINGRLAIAKGAPATGRVVAVKQKKGYSYDGTLEVAIDSVPAVNGENVALAGHITVGGDSVTIGRKSHDAQLAKGHIVTAHVATETTVGN